MRGRPREPATRHDLAAADLVVVEVGANDVDLDKVADPACLPAAASGCYADTLAALGTSLTRSSGRSGPLDHRPDLRIALLGYWNVTVDGQVGQQRGDDFVAGSDDLTKEVNATVEQVAAVHPAPSTSTPTRPLKGAVRHPRPDRRPARRRRPPRRERPRARLPQPSSARLEQVGRPCAAGRGRPGPAAYGLAPAGQRWFSASVSTERRRDSMSSNCSGPHGQRRRELDDGVPAVVGAAVEAGVEERAGEEAAQQPLALRVVERLPRRLVLDELDAVEVAGAAHVTDERQVEQLLEGGPEGRGVLLDPVVEPLALEDVEVGHRHRGRDGVPAEGVAVRERRRARA